MMTAESARLVSFGTPRLCCLHAPICLTLRNRAETSVGLSTVTPLMVFMAMVSVILSRLYTQIKTARQAEIEAINQQISGLTGHVSLEQ
jgi:hypothetical protein